MTDHQEIVAVLRRVYAAMDEHRFEDLRELFTDDVTALTPGGRMTGLDQLVAQARRNHRDSDGLQHLIGAELVTVTAPDTAELRANVVAVFATRGAAPTFALGEVYRARLRRTGSRWRICEFGMEPRWKVGERAPVPA
ncbi:DUF4440 domain-containing protein [Nakamurella sp. YIM 132087]|uniref:DUF4440 domain-containing protein n=1 Tax=Nakamurella alba TaxID=2665158 RepID=A0A7K1FF06_9ACTN|nr:nuclear transport factor 2 family protein [Nakamurella alba]MTD12656.1 DUF4440 domain-containing protein [Nakamurella alba]